MKELAIDIESFSDVDLSKCGVYRYASSPDFDILLFVLLPFCTDLKLLWLPVIELTDIMA